MGATATPPQVTCGTSQPCVTDPGPCPGRGLGLPWKGRGARCRTAGNGSSPPGLVAAPLDAPWLGWGSDAEQGHSQKSLSISITKQQDWGFSL